MSDFMQIFCRPYTKSLQISTYDTLKYWTIFGFEKKKTRWKNKNNNYETHKIVTCIYGIYGIQLEMIHIQAWKHLNKSPLSAYDYESFGYMAGVRAFVRPCVCMDSIHKVYKREKSSSKCNAQNKSHIIKEKTGHCIKREYIKIKAKQKREINFWRKRAKKKHTQPTRYILYIRTAHINMYGGKCDAHSQNTHSSSNKCRCRCFLSKPRYCRP